MTTNKGETMDSVFIVHKRRRSLTKPASWVVSEIPVHKRTEKFLYLSSRCEATGFASRLEIDKPNVFATFGDAAAGVDEFKAREIEHLVAELDEARRASISFDRSAMVVST